MPGSDWRTEQRQIPLIRRRDFISPGVALLGQHFAPRPGSLGALSYLGRNVIFKTVWK